MIQQRLVDYIKNQLKRGFDTLSIKNHLLNYGYDIVTVNEHIDYVFSEQKEVKHVIHFSKGTMFFLIGMFMLVILIGSLTYLYLKPVNTSQQLLDLKLDILTTSIHQGGILKFNIELANMGVIKRYDAFLVHQILENTGRVITSKEETIAIETRTSSKSEIKIPDGAKPGSYSLKTIARYSGRIATATEIFNVIIDEASCSDGIKNGDELGIDCGGSCIPCKEEKRCPDSCDDSNACTDDYCSKETNYTCVSDTITPCCGNSLCEHGETPFNCSKDCKEENNAATEEDIFKGLSIFEKLDKIKEVSKTNPDAAGKYCSSIAQTFYKDDCYSNLAGVTGFVSNCNLIEKERSKEECYSQLAIKIKDTSICKEIKAESRRDNCYMNFVIEGEYSICQQIVNDYLRQSCDALNVMSKINQTVT